MKRPALSLVLIGLFSLSAVSWVVAAEKEATKSESSKAVATFSASGDRLLNAVKYLAADEQEGRGVGTKGLDRAGDYIAAQFKKLGLKTELFDGKPFQTFTMQTGAELGPKNEAALVNTGKEGKKLVLKLGTDFNTLSLGGSGKFDLPLVFVGYGITAKDEKYDDYAGIDVKDKAVIVMRHEPQQNNPHSAFNGTQTSPYAPYVRKISNAYEHGAAAVIFLTDDYDIQQRVEQARKRWLQAIDELTEATEKFKKIEKPTQAQTEEFRKESIKLTEAIGRYSKTLEDEYDPMVTFKGAGPGGESTRIPVIYVRRTALAEMAQDALGTDLAAIEREIDKGPTPHSRELKNWRLQGEVTVKRTEAQVKNVVGVLEGSGPKADETVVVGAHYDHLGYGGEGSFVPNAKEIHNGADDNGSGSAALLEVAALMAQQQGKLSRRVVFIAFTGEERGLIGSARYCKEPLYPLDKTVAMVNMDMVGRLTDNKLIIQGVDTAKEFDVIIDGLNKRFDFKLTKQPGGFGPSDHSSFYSQKVPVMHFFTGTHKEYHRPSDDVELINVDGMKRIAEMVAETTLAIAQADARPSYLESKRPAAAMGGGGNRPYFGSIPDFAQNEPGYALMGAAKDSPAEKAGMKAGDIIIKLGESRIGNLEDFDSALRKYKAGDKVVVVVKRGGKEVPLTVTLDPPR
ncbi:MAG: M20/M25/M40 family metallo-hydrolase [Planctomycetaceae bacterium]|nr:M20/M25/M40 family metallo-hydrolase [Planctomycetaceae bacterium]